MKVKEIQGFFEVCFRYDKKFSRPPRYDRFDTPPYSHQLANAHTLKWQITALRNKCAPQSDS